MRAHISAQTLAAIGVGLAVEHAFYEPVSHREAQTGHPFVSARSSIDGHQAGRQAERGELGCFLAGCQQSKLLAHKQPRTPYYGRDKKAFCVFRVLLRAASCWPAAVVVR